MDIDAKLLKEKVSKFLVNNDKIEVPDVIYHYCSLDSFMKILETKSIFMSHHSAMNDLSDTRLFFQLLLNKANSVLNETNKEKLQKFISNVELNLKDYFITCFSREPDVLSQWNMYGDQGKGVAIGFISNNMNVDHHIPNFSLDKSKLKGLFPVDYINDSKLDIVNDLIELVEKDIFNDPPSLDRFFIQKKHKSFIQEGEIRIVEIQDTRFNLNPDFPGLRTRYVGDHFNYRLKNNKELIPYRPHFYRGSSEDNYELDSIWLGPENKTDINILGMFLNKHRITLRDGVYLSSSPFSI